MDSVFIDRNTAAYFDSFGIEYVLQQLLSKIRDKYITHNLLRIQDSDPIMREFYSNTFVEYMLTGKTLLDFKKDEIIICVF